MKRDIAFNLDIATEYGVDVAILVHHIAFWNARNEANKKTQTDGKGWTYNTYEAFSKLYPFWSTSQIKRILQKAKTQGAIDTANWNKKTYDRTLWYCITDTIRELYAISSTRKDGTVRCKGRNRPMQETKSPNGTDAIVPPIPGKEPVNTTVSTTDTIWPENEAFQFAWSEWKKERKERRKTLTPRAAMLGLQKLQKLTNDPEHAILIIAQSIERVWATFYPLKNDKRKSTSANKSFDPDKLRDHIKSRRDANTK